MKIGLIVNPVAGMGGSVGLKGTDGAMYQRAVALGADPVAPSRTRAMLTHVFEAWDNQPSEDVVWLVAPGQMGADYVGEMAECLGVVASPLDISYRVVGAIGEATTAKDTRRIAKAMLEAGIALLVFVGGDGTARDIADVCGPHANSEGRPQGIAPTVAVPAGVKVYSGVFARSARAAAEIVMAFVEERTEVIEAEVLDIDEDAFRDDRLSTRLHGYLLVPRIPRFLQSSKQASSADVSVEENKRDIAAGIVEAMDPETLYLLGPGTTVKAIADALGVPKTLLGVDAVYGGELVGRDLPGVTQTNETSIMTLLDRYPAGPGRKIVVTPLGGNGFIFGRGNKQFMPEVIRRVGKAHIIVVSTMHKVRQLSCLWVDTGDPAVDEMLSGYLEVTIGYRHARVMKVCY